MANVLTTTQPTGQQFQVTRLDGGTLDVTVSPDAPGGAAPAPVPGVDDGGVAEAGTGGAAGTLVYVRGTTPGDQLTWNGTKWAASASTACAKTGTVTTGAFACAENNGTVASGDASHAEGQNGESRGQASHAEGFNGLAAADHSHVEGSGGHVSASGTSAHAEGQSSFCAGVASHCEGRNGTANGDFSHVEGNGCRVDAANSHAEGDGCIITNLGATASHVEGNNTTCTGPNAHAEGRSTSANADGAHAEGVGTGATGTGGHAEGVSSSCSGFAAHSEGYQNTATGDASHVQGQSCHALGVQSHAEGFQSVAQGNISHASGATSCAWNNSDYAHAGGGFAVAGDAQFRSTELQGATPGNAAGESQVLTQGILAEAVNLRPSTSYGCKVRATATRMALGAAPREAVLFDLLFLLTVDSAGVVTVSAVTAVGPIVAGAGFVGATLVPSGVNQVGATPPALALTFAIAGGLTVQSRIVAHIEYVEILGN